MKGLFEKIKKDLKKGIEEGFSALKEGATIVSKKINEVKVEGKRQYKIFDMKSKIHDQMAELGGRVYTVHSDNKSLDEDNKIKALSLKIKKLEWQLHKIEGDKIIKTVSPKKTNAKAKAKKSSQPSSKKTAAKKQMPPG
jgi:regulator of replication initiation timing